jgi:alkanesulfonate monooxygenase SsuD/methylene tetrahydromethanopterin reductase-like flavin-dependent oxidoreductase (luciferase family)
MTDAQLDRYTIAGTPSEVIHGLAAYAEVGTDHVILDLVGDGQDVQQSLELLADALAGRGSHIGIS